MAAASRESVLDITAQQVAAVYAKAFLGAAESAGNVDSLVEELDSLVDDVLAKFPEFEKLLASQFVSHEERCALLDRVLGGRAQETMLAFLKVLSAHDRLNLLRAIRKAVRNQYNEMRGRREVLVTTAVELDDQLRSELEAQLRRMLKLEPHLTIATDPSLLGGAIVRVGDTVYDGSVATRLRQLRTQAIDRTVEQIETSRERFLS